MNVTERSSYLWQVQLITDQYSVIHPYMVITICILGTFANLINVVVLRRPAMCNSPTNTILSWLSVVQTFLLFTFFGYTVYARIDDDCRYTVKSYLWLWLLRLMVTGTVVLHTVALSYTVLLGVCRYIVIHWVTTTCITVRNMRIACTSILIVVPLCCTSIYFNSNIAIKNMSDCVQYQPDKDAYQLSYSDDVTLVSLNLWLFSVSGKILPCLCLLIVSALLIKDMREAAARRARLLRTQSKQDKRQRQARATTLLLLVILCMFILVELPQGILGFLFGLEFSGVIGNGSDMPYRKLYAYLGDIFEMLTVLYSSLNFILYCSMSSQFRECFMEIFRKKMAATNQFISRNSQVKLSINTQTNQQTKSIDENESAKVHHNQKYRKSFDVTIMAGTHNNNTEQDIQLQRTKSQSQTMLKAKRYVPVPVVTKGNEPEHNGMVTSVKGATNQIDYEPNSDEILL